MISDFWAVLRVISTILCDRPIQRPMLFSTSWKPRIIPKYTCRSNKLTKKNPGRRKTALLRYEPDGYEPPRLRVDLHVAAWQRRVGGHGLAMSDLGDLGRGQTRRRPAFERGVGRQQQPVETLRATGGRGLELVECFHGTFRKRAHGEAPQSRDVTQRSRGPREVFDERADVRAFRAPDVQRELGPDITFDGQRLDDHAA